MCSLCQLLYSDRYIFRYYLKMLEMAERLFKLFRAAEFGKSFLKTSERFLQPQQSRGVWNGVLPFQGFSDSIWKYICQHWLTVCFWLRCFFRTLLHLGNHLCTRCICLVCLSVKNSVLPTTCREISETTTSHFASASQSALRMPLRFLKL